MKYTTYTKIFLTAVYCVCSMVAVGQGNSLGSSLERAVLQAQSAQLQKVEVTARLKKPVKISDLMWRRPRCRDMVVRVDYIQKQCTGVLAGNENGVFVPASCLTEPNYSLAAVQLHFVTGQTVKVTQKPVNVTDELVFIRL